MRPLTILLAAVFLTWPLCVKSQAMGKKESSSESRSPQSYEQNQRAQSGQGTQLVVRGTAIAVDPNTDSITVAEYVSGSSRTFAAAKGALNDIKTGDRVSVTPEHENPNRAQKVQKE